MIDPKLQSMIEASITRRFGPQPTQLHTDICPGCSGTGSITTRFGGDGGCFPDEDMCMRCSGTGQVARNHHDIIPARVS